MHCAAGVGVGDPTGVPGVLVGSRVAPYIPGKPLRVILACMLIFVGARLLLS